jgi:EAL and modified HD-GYP domain-containing signal transduction protein
VDIYIARQPIFDLTKRLYAYELLIRESTGTQPVDVDQDRATTSLLSSAFLTEGLEKITGGKLCFIRFTEELLLKGIATFFPNTKMVVEIPEDLVPTAELLEACKQLFEQGYLVALDHFVYRKELDPLIKIADIIKFDIHEKSLEEIEKVFHRLSHYDLKFLAVKVETYEEFYRAAKLGFTYFQGDFFSQPEMLRVKELASLQHNLINLLAEVNRSNTTIDRLNEIISTDVGVTYKLLRYINSAHFYLLREVTSVRQAIQYLGADEIRRFVSLVIISEVAADKPEELIRLSIIRARFCELLAMAADSSQETSKFFLLGLFSLLEPLLDTPIDNVMQKLPLADALKEALIEQKGVLFPYLEIVTEYERGELEKCIEVIHAVGVDEEEVSSFYMEAVHFAGSLME